MSALLAYLPHALGLIFLVFVLFPVLMAGSKPKVSGWVLVLWTLLTLCWLGAAGVAFLILPAGAMAMTGAITSLAGFAFFGIILIMVTAWRLNAVGWTRWLAILTPFLPFSLILITLITIKRPKAASSNASAHASPRKAAKPVQKSASKPSPRRARQQDKGSSANPVSQAAPVLPVLTDTPPPLKAQPKAQPGETFWSNVGRKRSTKPTPSNSEPIVLPYEGQERPPVSSAPPPLTPQGQTQQGRRPAQQRQPSSPPPLLPPKRRS